ncbi:MAG TPA: acyl-CoA dehydrogenase, partial [Enterovirga sp.]
MSASPSVIPADLLDTAERAAADVQVLVAEAARRVRARVTENGRISPQLVDAEQHAAHGLSWLATYATAIRELAAYGRRLAAEGRFGETETLLVRIGIGEYLDQIFSGIAMSQSEIVRLAALGLPTREAARFRTEAVEELIETGNTPENRARLVALI